MIIAHEISGIGFQPVMPETTGWKPIPHCKSDTYFSLGPNEIVEPVFGQNKEWRAGSKPHRKKRRKRLAELGIDPEKIKSVPTKNQQ